VLPLDAPFWVWRLSSADVDRRRAPPKNIGPSAKSERHACADKFMTELRALSAGQTVDGRSSGGQTALEPGGDLPKFWSLGGQRAKM